ncbi:MAG: ABC transporter ATP-binding protein/permease, partial [Alphaproteobacteria bacterium]|nr:ABC transporter ATP-binding protein/permease [Alphaproteobacteria bacterium]
MAAEGPPPPRTGAGRALVDLVALIARSKASGLKTRLGLALALVLVGKAAGVLGPLLISRAIDQLSRATGHGHLAPVLSAQTALILFSGLAAGFVALRALAAVTPYVRDVIFTPVSQQAVARAAAETFGHALGLSLAFHQTRQTGALFRTIDRGARAMDFLLRSVVFNLGPSAVELVMAAWVLAGRFDWRLAAVAVVTTVFYVVFSFAITDWRLGHRRDLNAADTRAAGLAVDALMNHETIKAFGAEGRATEAYGQAMHDYARAAVRANASLQLLNGVQAGVLNLGLLLTVLIAGSEVLAGRMTLGGITACILILQQVYAPLFTLGTNYREIRQGFIDMEAMLALRATPPEIVAPVHPRALPPAQGPGATLAFENVAFRHPGRSGGLEGVSFDVAAGATTALVGPSGGGKTTLVRLALRLIDPQAGAVRLDGVDLRDLDPAELRRNLALVPQDVALFNDTLYANIAFGAPGASKDEVWAAAEAAELLDFIDGLPLGMETLVGERGLKLSGGERQRVGIARALIARPRLLLLDEATSALDGPTEAAIQETLRKARRGRTTLVVAHRLSTIMDADQI